MTLSAAEGRHGRRDNAASVSEGAECKRQRIIHPLPESLLPLPPIPVGPPPPPPSRPVVVSLSRKMYCTCHRGDVAAHRTVSITACASRIIVLKYNQSVQFRRFARNFNQNVAKADFLAGEAREMRELIDDGRLLAKGNKKKKRILWRIL